MSLSVLLSPAPGWYPDPAGQSHYRWWDGDGWTEGTHDGEQPAFEAAAEPSWFVPEPVARIPLFAEPVQPVQPVQQAQSAPASAPIARAPRPATAPAKTRWSSLLFAFPFVFPIAVGMVLALGYAGGAAGNIITLAVIGAVAALALLAVAFIFADHDRRELIARGYEPAPSLGWMLLLPPVAYLIARRRVVGPAY